MFKWLFDNIRAFLFDDREFVKMGSKLVANLRAALMLAGLTSVAYSEQLAAYASSPQYAEKIKLGGVIVAGLSVWLRAGDKTPEAVKALADQSQQ
jgi:hypothetical protein